MLFELADRHLQPIAIRSESVDESGQANPLLDLTLREISQHIATVKVGLDVGNEFFDERIVSGRSRHDGGDRTRRSARPRGVRSLRHYPT